MGIVKPSAKKLRKRRFFFWEGKLHRVLRINYPANLVEAWCYADRRSVSLLYTDYRRNSKPALFTHEVVQMLGIHRNTITNYLMDGSIESPEWTYALDGRFRNHKRMWSEENVLELHDAFLERHQGRPRKDGKITPAQKLPTRAQIKAMFRNEQTLYVQDDDGKLIPIFEQPRW